ncbi:MAG: tetraacyldisaccharide 4'-kinase [Planctomycetaceae bacterium]
MASLARGGLAAASLCYRAGVWARNECFDRGWKRTFAAGVPVVSVGNVTAGGTGKTPVVAFLTRWFVDQGLRPVILSRGYRAFERELPTPERINDEKLVLARLCPGIPHVQNPDRVAGARRAVDEYAAQVLILDDGFQHRRLRRDLDIVLIDAVDPFGYGRLLPRGLLREPLSGLRRADAIVISRADRLTDDSRRAILATIAPYRPAGETPIEIAFPPADLVDASGARTGLAAIRDKKVGAFCGIGNPPAFRRTLDDLGANVVHWRTFPDHHHYTAQELDDVAAAARVAEAEILATTLKDLVKIAAEESGGLPLWGVNIGARVLRGGDALEQLLGTIAAAVASPPRPS